MRGRGTCPFNDFGHGVLAQPHLTANQSVAAPFFDQRENPWRQTARLRSLPFLPAEAFATRNEILDRVRMDEELRLLHERLRSPEARAAFMAFMQKPKG